MIVEIDIGNTRAKWRVRQDSIEIGCGSVSSAIFSTVDGLQNMIEGMALSAVQSAHIASVVNINESFFVTAFARWDVTPCFAVVQKECAGVCNAYDDVSQMGIDRWLALLAASRISEGRAVLVVDAGSAITVDLLGANGVHLGGYIGPGLRLLKKSLLGNTDKVNVVDVAYPVNPVAGCSTTMAVFSALSQMVKGLVMSAYVELEASQVSCGKPLVCITGGDGGYINELIDEVPSLLVPDLVLDGLAVSVNGA